MEHPKSTSATDSHLCQMRVCTVTAPQVLLFTGFVIGAAVGEYSLSSLSVIICIFGQFIPIRLRCIIFQSSPSDHSHPEPHLE